MLFAHTFPIHLLSTLYSRSAGSNLEGVFADVVLHLFCSTGCTERVQGRKAGDCLATRSCLSVLGFRCLFSPAPPLLALYDWPSQSWKTCNTSNEIGPANPDNLNLPFSFLRRGPANAFLGGFTRTSSLLLLSSAIGETATDQRRQEADNKPALVCTASSASLPC